MGSKGWSDEFRVVLGCYRLLLSQAWLAPVAMRGEQLGEVVAPAARAGAAAQLRLDSRDVLGDLRLRRVADHVALLHNGRLILSQPLDQMLASHRRVTVRFSEPQPAGLHLAGALSCTGEGREWTCVCNGQFEQLKQAAAARGGEVVEEATASLDDVFVSRVKG